MKRLVCQCGAIATCESDLWPSIKLCNTCYNLVAAYFVTRMPELLDGNPLSADLMGLEPIGDRYRVWIIGDSYVCKEHYFGSRKLTLDKSVGS